MSGYLEWGGDDDQTPDLGGNRLDKFKGEKDKSYRISMALWPLNPDGTLNMDAKKPRFIGGKRIFVDGFGYVLAKGPEFQQYSAKGEEPRMASGTLLVNWPLNPDGTVNKEEFKRGGRVQAWIFTGDQKYKALQNQWVNWPAGQHDLMALCTDKGYQKFEFSPLKDNLLRFVMEKPELKDLADSLLAQIKFMAERLPVEIARDVKIEEIRLKLKGGASAPVAASAMSARVDDMLSDIIE